MEDLNPLGWFTESRIREILWALLFAVIVAAFGSLVSRRVRNFIRKSSIAFWYRRRKVLKDIKTYVCRRHGNHRAAGLIAGNLLKKCIIQLFGPGENVSLAEYATLLQDSLKESSMRFIAVSTFLPSDWYAPTPALPAITEYLQAQQQKRGNSKSIEMMRIVLANPKAFETDPRFTEFKSFHVNNHIALWVYDKDLLPDLTYYRDFALFEDEVGCWIVESHDLDRKLASTVHFKEYLEKVSIIDDDKPIKAYYESLIKTVTTHGACTTVHAPNSADRSP